MTSAESTTTSASTTPASTLAGSWNLATFTGAQGSSPAVAGAVASLTFGADSALTGTTGCNNFSGSYAVTDARLSVSIGPMTQRACIDPAAESQERALLDGLPKVSSFDVSDKVLTLSGSSGEVLFTYAEGLRGLAGTRWRATGVNNGREAVESTALTENLTAEFGSDATMSGSGGCNTFHANYTAAGQAIAITSFGASEMACSADVTALEQQYFTALQAATSYDVTGNVLTLRDGGGAIQVVFSAEP